MVMGLFFVIRRRASVILGSGKVSKDIGRKKETISCQKEIESTLSLPMPISVVGSMAVRIS